MSENFSKTLRKTLLAVATAAALSPFAVTSAFAQAKVKTAGLDNANAYNGFIVRYRAGSEPRKNSDAVQQSLDQSESIAIARAGNSNKPVKLKHARRLAIGADVVRPDRKLNKDEAIAAMNAIAADPNVEYVEPDYIVYPSWTPNDTHYGLQYGYASGTGGARADQAWDSARGDGVVVAVLDTGITTHSDMGANVLSGYDFISDSTRARDGNGRDNNPADQGDWITANQCGYTHSAQNSSWHGTHVAGTVAAVTNNAKGVAGAAPNAKIVPVRVLGACGGATSDIADAIVWASGGTVSGIPANANPAEVINMSLGSSAAATCSSTYQNAINSALGRGTIVVAAAGNQGTTANHMPGNCTGVINVAASTSSGSRASFSNYGSRITIAAPGEQIASTVNSGTTTPSTEGYSYMSGTSMASPLVAGIVALVQSKASTPRTPAQMTQILQSTARAMPGSCSGGCGAGLIDAKAAVAAVSGTTPPPTGSVLQNGVPVTGLSGAAGSEKRWTVSVPSGRSQLRIVMSGGSGDADLYVRSGTAPTTTTYQCRPYLNGNNETCTFTAPAAGTWHVLVRGYSRYSGASITATY